MGAKLKRLDERITLIDGFDLGLANRTGSYVINEEELTIVETGPSMSVPHILEGLKELNLHPQDVKYIIVTHIHLDHAGGAGLLLNDCPNARVVVHPRGAKHLVDPARLIQGAKLVYGEDFDRLFEPVVPIPENRIIIKNDKETLTVGKNCTLTFYDTPGHSYHHFSIYDPVSNGIFTGDTIGVSYDESLKDVGIQLYLPSTSPNQFNPDDMLRSLERIQRLHVSKIYFGHFAESEHVDEVYKQIKQWLPQFVKVGKEAMDTQPGSVQKEVTKNLYQLIKNELRNHGVPDDHPVYEFIKLDTSVCAMGLFDYFQKQQKNR
ncbi:glyoxylase-like metal-dependent hydrolase (beta-lactamase superfamily II) [Melghiribacillus thermohalophilus]|uniref:Glyoxylase-like metal-dependent hydrolase (Beta-lactamase superfamily II) n=1 Tax=Melghiribacillus thermohalophilus TaxID=1324956 RepID=A0A4R3ND69_9BACI|nr:MBL fold metallo-hydrolase [Melghiribacillus thermohalophilus]TCT25099.1 glyoxylase-like metal-dependent hydrolase (beta-lactamase superfamily II) [Melghiribacillus thermohalophilus]